MDYKERKLTEYAEQLERCGNNVPVAVAAAMLGKQPAYVHEGIIAGTLPIGSYIDRGSGKCAFNIPPLRLLAYLTGGDGNAEMCLLREEF